MDEKLVAKLRDTERKHEELTQLLGDPMVLSDQERLTKYARSHAELSATVEKAAVWREVVAQLRDAKGMLVTETDTELREMVQLEIDELTTQETKLEE